VNADSKTERRAVRVASTSPQGLIISAGLTGTERIVTTAGAFLQVGEKVQVAAARPDAT
jgi:HlyD family secretion protein